MFNVLELNKFAKNLPVAIPEFTPHAGRPDPYAVEDLSDNGKVLLEAWKPLLDKVDFKRSMAGADIYKKHFELTAKLTMAQMLTNMARQSPSEWHKEATTAGSDMPSYGKNVIGTILRAYPRMIALQLFGVTPFSQRDGRVWFMDVQYNSAYVATAPNIADGDRTDDLTKFNKNYFQINELATANKMKMKLDSLVYTAQSYRVVSDWSYEGDDDYAAQFGGDLSNALVGNMARMLVWVTDRELIDAALAAAPAGNNVSWTAQPAGYASFAPSEKKAYDESIWADGILPIITKISVARALTTAPNWAIADPASAEKLMKLTTFVPTGLQNDAVTLNHGPIRDIGTLNQVGIRVLVDPQMTANTILFGRKPVGEFDASIHYCPYKPIRTTGTLETPVAGSFQKGVYSRFAIAKPNTGTLAASSQLGDVYGKLTIV